VKSTCPTQPFPAMADVQAEAPPFAYYVPFPRRAIFDAELTDLDRSVLLGILSFLEPRQTDCLETNQAIAERVRCTEGGLRISLMRLEKRGYLKRVPDRFVPQARRRIELQYRTWGAPAPKSTPDVWSDPIPGAPQGAPRIGSPQSQEPPRARPGLGHPNPRSPLSPISSKKECKRTSKGATVLSHPEEPTRIDDPAPIPKPERVEPPGAGIAEDEEQELREMLAGPIPALRRHAESKLRAAGKLLPGDDPPAAAEDLPPPSAPAAPAPARPRPCRTPIAGGQLPPQAVDDRAWAILMAMPPDAEPPRPEPRPEVGGPRSGLVVVDRLVDAYAADGGEASLAALIDCLSARWRDWKPETRAFWRSAFAELRTGLLAIDEFKGLIRDADRREVKRKSRKFSSDLGEVLAARRHRPPGPAPQCPGGRFKSQCSTEPNYTTSRSPRQ
jgi:hypothetical protein